MGNIITVNYLNKLAKDNQGFCLSKEYLGWNEKYKWKCKNNHIWKTKYFLIKRGHWCRKCYQDNQIKKSFLKVKEIIKKNNGKLLSKNFNGILSKVKVQCENKHVWWGFANNIYRNRWCKRCSCIKINKHKRLGIEYAKKLALKKGGVCLSNNYKNINTKLKWKCKNNHIWTVSLTSVKQSWCPHCAGNLTQTIEDIKKIAINRGGKCLSKIYINCKKKLIWKCEKKHIWFASTDNIKRGKWCPYCKRYKNENKVRKIFEEIFNKKFPTKRPIWLKTSKKRGGRLELDGYNKDLELAFEYDGEQHYYFVSFIHKKIENFMRSIERDRIKNKLCKKNGVKLIRIPYTEKLNLKQYIKNSLKEIGVLT